MYQYKLSWFHKTPKLSAIKLIMVEIIAIDGPASVGKSTLAKKISNYYKAPLLNSGRLYRAVALKIINKKININNKYKILQCAKSLTDENIKIKSFGDHRIAMSFSILNMLYDNKLKIDNKKCINISYPDFTKHLNYLL